MPFFNTIFGGQKEQKKTAPPAKQPSQDTTQQKKIKIESACNALDLKIKDFEDKQKKFQHKIDLLKNKAKQLLQADKKKQAKKYVQEATRVQKQMESYTLRKKALVDKKFQLEQAMMDMDTIDAIQGAQVHIKDIDKLGDKLEDLILDGQQAKIGQKQIEDKIRDLVGNQSQDEEVDDMLNQLMGEVKAENKKKVQGNTNVNDNIPAGKQVNKAKQEEDDIARMMAELG